MKKAKFLAILLTTSALSLGFVSCGDDDDKSTPMPTPTTNPPVAQITPNSLTIDGTKIEVNYGWAERMPIVIDGQYKYKIILQSLPQDYYLYMEPTVQIPLHIVNITFLAPAADTLPEGKIDICQFYGEMNLVSRGRGLPYYNFYNTDDYRGQVDIKNNGSKYTITVNPIVLQYTKCDDCLNRTPIEWGKIVRTAFSFSGELPFTVIPE